MSEEILDPLDFYTNYLKAEHAENTSAFFEKMVAQSGVDAAQNAKTVAELRQLEQEADSTGNKCFWLKVALGIVFIAGAGAMFYLGAYPDDFPTWTMIFPPLLGLPLLYFLWMRLQLASSLLKAQKQKCAEKRKAAWAQLAKLNKLFTWDIALEIVEQSFPGITFDLYFNNARMREMHEQFGWSGNLGVKRSVLHTHSGAYNGNPFVLAKTLNHWMDKKTYTGSLTISWTTQEKNAEGKWQTVRHSQTLTASVTEPFPEYDTESFIIYANEAAPELTFSRVPSNLSSLGDSKLDRFRKQRAVRKLEKRSLKGKDNFTVMANREFESLFGATDRDHEVQFRLLFTPLAQQQMLKLLKDKEIGYGDDFDFTKDHMINILRTNRLQQIDIDGNPEKFRHYELAEMRKFFNQYHQDFMHAFFFGLAPLLTIPLYRQHRSHGDIYKDTYAGRPCFWEHESIANDYGDARFAHPKSVTRNILKTTAKEDADNVEKVQVTAHGFRAESRLTHVSMRGGDGKMHNVPVHWKEYLPVQETSDLLVGAEDKTADNPLPKSFEAYGLSEKALKIRRSLFSARMS